MNCELKTILDSSSLYRNGVLINYATISFVVEKCVNVNLSISSGFVCCMGKQLTRICFNVRNNDNRFLQGAILMEQTLNHLKNGALNIAEATFVDKGGYCQIDILHKNENNMYDIVEVKSTSAVKPHYIDDIAYQYYVTKDLIPVEHCYILHINNEYRRMGELTNDLFELEDVTKKAVEKLTPKIKKTAKKSEQVDPNKDLIGEAIKDILFVNDNDVPTIKVHSRCDDQWECPFMNDCIKTLEPEEQELMTCLDLKRRKWFIQKAKKF